MNIAVNTMVTKRNNGNGSITKFKPEEAKKRDAIFDAGLQLAKKMRNPEAVQKAAYLKVQHQIELVAWWDNKEFGVCMSNIKDVP